MQLSGKATLYHGEWMLVKWSEKAGTRMDIEKRCRKCRTPPVPGRMAWMNLKLGWIYCQACFQP